MAYLFLGTFAFIWILVLAFVVVAFILNGILFSGTLKALGYKNPWMGWIPFAVYFALADVVEEDEPSKITMFGNFKVPTQAFKLWWIGKIVLPFVPVIGALLSTALTILCFGRCMVDVYGQLEGVDNSEVLMIGYLSGWIRVIAWVKLWKYRKGVPIA